jgi:tRNA pseudouridine55 synthase
MFGLLNIDKPAGMTSRDVVNRVQRQVRPVKVGHAGTLDPLATGVLVVCLGQATRLIEYVQRMPKRYRGTFLLGRESDTEDIEGNVVELANAPEPTLAAIEAALPKFLGEIEQRPPAYSALKVEGQRAYKLARRGEQVELAPRKIQVYAVRMLRYEYPELELDIECGSGTYVRSLGRDLARELGTGAVMSALVRTAIGVFRVDEACQLESLSAESIESQLLPPSRAVGILPLVRVTKEEAQRLANGQIIENRTGIHEAEVAVENESGQLIAIVMPRDGSLAPTKYFPS